MAEKWLQQSELLRQLCRTWKNIINKNHPLDLFDEKAIKDGIVRDLEKFPS